MQEVKACSAMKSHFQEKECFRLMGYDKFVIDDSVIDDYGYMR